jgi:hypothetical protein
MVFPKTLTYAVLGVLMSVHGQRVPTTRALVGVVAVVEDDLGPVSPFPVSKYLAAVPTGTASLWRAFIVGVRCAPIHGNDDGTRHGVQSSHLCCLRSTPRTYSGPQQLHALNCGLVYHLSPLIFFFLIKFPLFYVALFKLVSGLFYGSTGWPNVVCARSPSR